MPSYDIIGDVHGHAAVLEELLGGLGYRRRQGCYRHPDRTAVFVGDLIDRGEENFKTLEIVKAMVDNDRALVVMGNHEFNALCYHTRGEDGRYLRPHIEKNKTQHREVLREIEERGNAAWEQYLEWFRRLPLFLDLEGFRVVHACWDRASIDFIRRNDSISIRDGAGRLTDTFLAQAVTEGTDAFDAVEILLKGKEIWLPADHPGIHDKDGNLRRKVRVKWWLTGEQRDAAATYDQVTRIDERYLDTLSKIEISGDILREFREDRGLEGSVPIFFGHYWFTGMPRFLVENAACLDYSVARGGHLVCYRWDGEQILDEIKFKKK
jgi:hypothetical protein